MQCEVIGHYDPNNDDSHFQLVDDRDPSKRASSSGRSEGDSKEKREKKPHHQNESADCSYMGKKKEAAPII